MSLSHQMEEVTRLPTRQLPQDFMPSSHTHFASLWHYHGGQTSFILELPGKPALVVQHRGTPTMCGGTQITVRGLSTASNFATMPSRHGFGTTNATDFFEYHRRGIVVFLAILTAEEAEAWLPIIERSGQLLAEHYRTKDNVLAVDTASWSQAPILAPINQYYDPMHVGTGNDRVTSYLWMMQHAHVANNRAYRTPSRKTCGICKRLVEGAICHDCGNWISGGHGAYHDDDGLTIDKLPAYSKNYRYADETSFYMLTGQLMSAHLNTARPTPLAYLTSWFSISDVWRGPTTRIQGTVLDILKDFLRKRYIPILTSNIGATNNARTPHVLAALYMNQDLLEQHGMRLCTVDTFGTNPKEHYHWIDSVAVVPISWAAIRRAS